MTDKQPRYGDGAINHQGNDGYGYEEHEHYVNRLARDGKPLDVSDTHQPMFGDGAVNHKGNNGYGFEEHEQYLRSNDSVDEKPAVLSVKDTPVEDVFDEADIWEEAGNIEIMAGDHAEGIRQLGNDWLMNYMGDAIYDDGEAPTAEHIKEITAMYYENVIPNKTTAFIRAVNEQFPDVDVRLSPLGPSSGIDMDRFDLDFGGLDDQEDDITLG